MDDALMKSDAMEPPEILLLPCSRHGELSSVKVDRAH